MNTQKTFSADALMDSRHPDYKAEIARIIRSNLTPKLMAQQIMDYHENDIAAALELLKKEERARLYRILSTADLAKVLSFSETPTEYMEELGVRQRVDVLSQLEPAAAVEYLRQL